MKGTKFYDMHSVHVETEVCTCAIQQGFKALRDRCAHHCVKCCSLCELPLLSEPDVPEGLLTTASNSSLLLMNSANASGCFFMQSCIAPKDFKQSDPCTQIAQHRRTLL